jgi:hypothetical protein
MKRNNAESQIHKTLKRKKKIAGGAQRGGGRSLRNEARLRARISLYPLDLETALGAALKTGGPPETNKRKVKKS